MNYDIAGKVADIYSALGNPVRLLALGELSDREIRFGDLRRTLDDKLQRSIPASTLSNYFKDLVDVGLAERRSTERKGDTCFHSTPFGRFVLEQAMDVLNYLNEQSRGKRMEALDKWLKEDPELLETLVKKYSAK